MPSLLIPLGVVQAVVVWVLASLADVATGGIIAGLFLLANTLLTFYLAHERQKTNRDPDPQHPDHDPRGDESDRGGDR